MSYQVIARKWRPQTFEEVTGQEHITQTLRNAIENDRLHHALLFSGARGVGKTTSARLYAKALNCHRSDRPTITPCRSDDAESCSSCTEITESRSIDVLEFDAASHTGVDDIRDLILEGINISAARDRYKVFIIDEVHMLSTSSFNALLKTLEEPPPNVAFIMATTELHKVPETITSRCQEFQFRTISKQKIFERLSLISEAENISISEEALYEIARSGEGSMRDAQSNFDQIINFVGENIQVSDVTSALGMAGTDTLTKVVYAVSKKQPAVLLDVVEDLVARGHDLRNFCRDLLSIFRDMLVAKVGGTDSKLLDSALFSVEQLAEMSAGFTESDLIRSFNLLSETEQKFKDSTRPRFTLELGLIKLAEMRSIVPIEDLIRRLSALPVAQADPKTSLQNESATAEKKTLISADPVEKPAAQTPSPPETESIPKINTPRPVELSNEPAFQEMPPDDEIPFEHFPDMPDDVSEDLPQYLPEDPLIDLSFVEDLPARTIHISSEDMEHHDDKFLDEAYEEKLRRSGDDLNILPNIDLLTESLLGTKDQDSDTAVTELKERRMNIADFAAPEQEIEEPVELPSLSSDPTSDELKAYGKAHPDVRKIMRLFKADFVDFTKV